MKRTKPIVLWSSTIIIYSDEMTDGEEEIEFLIGSLEDYARGHNLEIVMHGVNEHDDADLENWGDDG